MSASPLDERVEFLSNQWIESATRQLQRLVDANVDALRGMDYELTEVFEAAPPHLGWDGNVAAWTVRIRDGRVCSSPGRAADADCTISGNYQLALPAVQTIGSQAITRAQREAQFRAGRPVVSISGTPPSGPLASVFSELHDYLARRTVPNPDLGHRIAQQGLATKVLDLKEKGFAVLESAISAELTQELRQLVLDECETQSTLYTMGLLGRGRAFEEIVQHPTLLTLIESALGPAIILGGVTGSVKGPGPSVVPLHTDYSFVPDPYPEFALNGVAVWALDDWTEAAGPTVIIPGSHKLRRSPEPGVDKREGGASVIMPRGSVVFFSYGVWHWAADRTEPGKRVTLHNVYSRPFMRSHDSFATLEPGILHRNSPVLSGLAGRDDLFEKSGYYGHDTKRAAYIEGLINWGKTTGRGDERYTRSREEKAFASIEAEVSA
jgi:hypothetical protein